MTALPATRSQAAPRRWLITALCAAALLASGCDKTPGVPSPSAPPAPKAEAEAQPVAAVPVSAPAVPAAPVYVPPGAEQLYQMVAPIALYPDKLVAQVLAGSTYPDQVTAADQWLAQNAALKAGPLADRAEQQAWDPSIKSLTAFKPVLHQMASNLPWTTSLGQAYYNDPDDVMNAIQVMRARASKAGKLKSNTQLRVASGSAPAQGYAPDPNAPGYYGGPVIVEPPPQYITIEPARPDVVYVPSYDPRDIYGEPVAVYPGYAYAPPVYAEPREPRYSNAQIATAGALTFGTGVIVGAALQRHGWGWNSWDMNWGRPDAYRGGNRPPREARGFDRPAVVYNRSTYVSRTDEAAIHNNRRNNFIGNAGAPQGPAPSQVDAMRQQQQAQREQQQRQQQQMQMQQQQLVQQQQAQRQAQQQQAAQRAQQAQQAQMRQQMQQQAQGRQQQQQQQVQQQAQLEQQRRDQQDGQQRARMREQQQQLQQQRQQQQAAEQANRQQAQQAQAQQNQARRQQQQQQQQQQAQAEQQARQQQQAQQNQLRQQQQAQQMQARQQQAHQAQAQQNQIRQQQEQQQRQQQQQQQQAHQQQIQQRQQQQQQQAQQNQTRQQQAQQQQQQQQMAQAQQQRLQQQQAQGQRPNGRRPQDEQNR